MQNSIRIVVFASLVLAFSFGTVFAAIPSSQDDSDHHLLPTDEKMEEFGESINQRLGILSKSNTVIPASSVDMKSILLERLKEAHARGEFLDITEDMIKQLTEDEIEWLIADRQQADFDKEIKIDSSGDDSSVDVEASPNVMPDNISEMNTKQEKELFSAIRNAFDSETGVLGAYLTIIGGAGYGLLRFQRRLLARETSEERYGRLGNRATDESNISDPEMELKNAWKNKYNATMMSKNSIDERLRVIEKNYKEILGKERNDFLALSEEAQDDIVDNVNKIIDASDYTDDYLEDRKDLSKNYRKPERMSYLHAICRKNKLNNSLKKLLMKISMNLGRKKNFATWIRIYFRSTAKKNNGFFCKSICQKSRFLADSFFVRFFPFAMPVKNVLKYKKNFLFW